MAKELLESEPVVVETKGRWQPFEAMTGQTFEVGKTYKIVIDGVCEFAVSKDIPTGGILSNQITYTKEENSRLWIKTGG